MNRLAIATCAEFGQLTPDDQLLAAALRRAGLEVVPCVWNADDVQWDRFDGVLIRSVWDYHLAQPSFLEWVERTGRTLPVWNHPDLIRWNASKDYLQELAAGGIPTIPTIWIGRGPERLDLESILKRQGWSEAVLKPTIDLGALNLVRVRAGEAAAQESFDDLRASGDVMIQPFLQSVEARGETSILFVGGERSHAVEKLPGPDDFRVQERWGGRSRLVTPTATDCEIAEAALSLLPRPPLFARVDLVSGPDGERCLIELELIDPNFFFATEPAAAARFAAAVDGALRSGRVAI